jgi:GTP-binding protein LepA
MDKRGLIKNQVYLTSDRVELSFDMPLAEIVFDFFDRLKTISRGYASLDYEMIGFKQSHMVRLDVMLNGEIVDALSAIVHRDKAYEWGKRLVRETEGIGAKTDVRDCHPGRHWHENHREGNGQSHA